MILHIGPSTVLSHFCRPLRKRIVCFSSITASSLDTDQLRSQIDQLRAEADTTGAKASSARLRLIRLSEAAEKLKRQAAICVQSGKENEARELLFQKKKVMQALEKSKSRIEWFDELSAKLNQVVSVKESQLIGTIASDLDIDREDDLGSVHIIHPKNEGMDVDRDKDFVADALNYINNQDFQFTADNKSRPVKELKLLDIAKSEEASIFKTLKDISSYWDFLEHLDLQLSKIEAELVTILNISSFILNSEEKSHNLKVKQAIELLEDIQKVRQRVSRITMMKEETT